MEVLFGWIYAGRVQQVTVEASLTISSTHNFDPEE